MNEVMLHLSYLTSRASHGIACVLCAVALLMSGCGNSSGPGLESRSGPVRLDAPRRGPESAEQPIVSVLMPVDEARAHRAIENYRINKREKKSPYQFKGADLNGDGQAEILVLFTGGNWCAKTGCTLAVLTPGSPGYRTVSTIRRVKAPVIIAQQSFNGWHDIYVSTGGGGVPTQRVALKFSDRGYPGNATLLPAVPSNYDVRGDIVFAGAGSPVRGFSQAPSFAR